MLYNVPPTAWPQVIAAAMRTKHWGVAAAALAAAQQASYNNSTQWVLLQCNTKPGAGGHVALAPAIPALCKWQVASATCPAQGLLLQQWASGLNHTGSPGAVLFVPLAQHLIGVAYNP